MSTDRLSVEDRIREGQDAKQALLHEFAAKAMHAEVLAAHMAGNTGFALKKAAEAICWTSEEIIASRAYDMAEAMLKEWERRS